MAKPFPQEERFVDTVKLITGISVFVTVFLYVFKPFGLHTMETGLWKLCLGFGVATLLASLVYEMVMVHVLRLKGGQAKFTFGRWILYFMGAMLVISLANFLFARWYLFGDIQWSLFPVMMRGTMAIGIFPIIVIGAVALLRQEQKYQGIAGEMNQQNRSIDDASSNNKLIFGINVKQILFIEAMQNYINIGYMTTDGHFQETMERATLKSILSDDLWPGLVRCHRSFLVNKGSISHTSGNAQGLLLTLVNGDKTIPVSRSYVSNFRQQ